ncbi:DUF5686 and carboxypeptidase-like regulatory domain-containing protein [Bacteroides sp. 519]|uniref:DUF5686 and carboxypeptidase-like regulatory domain-containing protein n=1 Tax=Bacteroides sp. 519 TaxID=2302937 RepID=UPI0013D0189C|nr:DUF5686 and carboxypeptidase-like regulatory domain-containing protein [Bacteroides sp. 519]NDV59536.1 carboxypeptidase-like regulatory domain-containing protein [Bacteroides sp. 519]
MRNLYIKIVLLLLLAPLPGLTFAQIRGVITDSISNEPLMYISVYYEGKGVGTVSNVNGEYSLEVKRGWNEITFSAIGYNTKVVKITPGTQTLNVKLSQSDIMLSEVIVKPKRERYSRKNNPAVEFMRKVIAHKSEQKLEEHDYYQYDRYQKMKTSLNDMTPEKMKEGIFKNMPLLVDQLEVSPESNKLILPISVEETAAQIIYRKNPKSEKTIIKGMNSGGIQDLFATGDMIGTVLEDVFSNINIYDNDIRLLQQHFVSPISNSAISFYQFYLMDTIMVDRHECVHLTFVPGNSQDFGFTGHLYVLNDSTYAVKRCTMNLPKKTGVNFVENLDIIQEYAQLPNGQWVLTDDDMVVDLSLYSFLQGLQVRRTTKNTNYSFEDIEPRLFRLKGSVIKDADMLNRSDEFWAEMRQVPITKTESSMDLLVNQLEQIPGFKYIIFVAKAFIENHVETGTKDTPSKFDFGPINTIITSNYVDGTRFRLSGRTTAKLNPNWFLSGYGAYGLRDKKWKYEGAVTYSFTKREFFPWEFPRHNIALSHRYDVMSPMDKFLTTDKDNVFVSWKTTTVDQMSYVRETSLKYEIETNSGFSVVVTGRHRNDEPAGNLHYFRNNPEKTLVHDITTAEAGITLRYAPGETYVNTKQRRLPVSLDAPVYTLSHTMGLKALGGEYKFNLTEASLWKRIWLSSWGKMDVTLKAGAQWNKVPFPLLILPAANLSYITQQETFTLINNMEFLNDRYASIALTYDMNGKLFNRIPLIKKLKWREAFRFRALVGNLTDKNNPYLNTNDTDLFLFPTRNGRPTSFVMDTKIPYMEFAVGIHNIFKLIHIEYVRRLTYLDNPGINKDGIRFMILMKF